MVSNPFTRDRSGLPSTQQQTTKLQLELERLKKENDQLKQQEQLGFEELQEKESKLRKQKGETEQA